MAEIGLRGFLELAQDHRGDFGRRELLAVDLDLYQFLSAANDLVGNELFLGLHLGMPTSHETLDGVDGAPRVGDCLAFRWIADESFAFIGEGDDAWSQAQTFLVGDDFCLAPFHDGDDGVRRAQVDADDFFFSHNELSFQASKD